MFTLELNEEYSFNIENFDETLSYQVNSETGVASIENDTVSFSSPNSVPSDEDNDLIISIDGENFEHSFDYSTNEAEIFATRVVYDPSSSPFMMGYNSSLSEQWETDVPWHSNSLMTHNDRIYLYRMTADCHFVSYSTSGQEESPDKSGCENQNENSYSYRALLTNNSGIFLRTNTNSETQRVWKISHDLNHQWFLETQGAPRQVKLSNSTNNVALVESEDETQQFILFNDNGSIIETIPVPVDNKANIGVGNQLYNEQQMFLKENGNELYYISENRELIHINLSNQEILNKKSFKNSEDSKNSITGLEVDSGGYIVAVTHGTEIEERQIHRVSSDLNNTLLTIDTPYDVKGMQIDDFGNIYITGGRLSSDSSDTPAVVKYNTNGSRVAIESLRDTEGGGIARIAISQ